MESAENGWRRLALQFDNHRMQALGHLKAMVQDPDKHKELAEQFLSDGPLSGEEVLVNRIQSMSKIHVGKLQSELTNRLEQILREAKLGQGSFHTNYDGNKLGAAIESMLSNMKGAR